MRSDDVKACAELVRAADPHRFRAAMTATPDRRPGLFALFALNIEVARAPWVTREPGLGAIRLQYWHDQIARAYAGQPVDPQPTLAAMAGLIAAQAPERATLMRLISARQADFEVYPFADPAALMAYLADTSGGLLQLAAAHLSGATDPKAARGIGMAAGLAGYFLAVPELKSRGRQPLPDETPAALADLAQAGLAGLAHTLPAAARPALLTASEARPVLGHAARRPTHILAGNLIRAEARIRARQLICGLAGGV